MFFTTVILSLVAGSTAALSEWSEVVDTISTVVGSEAPSSPVISAPHTTFTPSFVDYGVNSAATSWTKTYSPEGNPGGETTTAYGFNSTAGPHDDGFALGTESTVSSAATLSETTQTSDSEVIIITGTRTFSATTDGTSLATKTAASATKSASSTSNPAAGPTALASHAAAGVVAIVGLICLV